MPQSILANSYAEARAQSVDIDPDELDWLLETNPEPKVYRGNGPVVYGFRYIDYRQPGGYYHATKPTDPAEPRYPDILVELPSGNAYGILGEVTRALRQAELPEVTIGRFRDEATSGDYDRLLRTCMEWVDVA